MNLSCESAKNTQPFFAEWHFFCFFVDGAGGAKKTAYMWVTSQRGRFRVNERAKRTESTQHSNFTSLYSTRTPTSNTMPDAHDDAHDDAHEDPTDAYYLNDDPFLTDDEKRTLSASFGQSRIPGLAPPLDTIVRESMVSFGRYAHTNSMQLPDLMRKAITLFLLKFPHPHRFDGTAAWNSPFSAFAMIIAALACTTPGTEGATRMALLVQKILASACKFASESMMVPKTKLECAGDRIQVLYIHLTQAVEETFPVLFKHGGMVSIMEKIFNSPKYMGGCGICGAQRLTIKTSTSAGKPCTRVVRTFRTNTRQGHTHTHRSSCCLCMKACGHAAYVASLCARVSPE
jgi:hypothetical protein